MSAATSFVFPSLYEGFGLPVLEAMYCGTPVVTSNAGALPEVVDRAGILVKAGDATALGQAIDKVVATKAIRERLIAAGQKRAQQFSWDKCAQETLAVYQQVAEADK
jgi:glycosyltransferase involved in cell wall biosynthesis